MLSTGRRKSVVRKVFRALFLPNPTGIPQLDFKPIKKAARVFEFKPYYGPYLYPSEHIGQHLRRAVKERDHATVKEINKYLGSFGEFGRDSEYGQLSRVSESYLKRHEEKER